MNEVKLKNCTGRLFFGACPEIQQIKELKNHNVNCIWNLLEEMPFIFEYEKNIFDNSINTPIKDFDIPKDIKLFIYESNIIYNRLKNGENIFVHCLGGRGRTGIALAFLLLIDDLNNNKDILNIVYNCSRGPENKKQKDFVLSLMNHLV